MRRTFWAATGFTLGVGSSVYVRKRLRRAIQRYTPEQMRQEMTSASSRVTRAGKRVVAHTRDLLTDVREAIEQGGETMRETEHDLRSELDAAKQRSSRRPTRISY